MRAGQDRQANAVDVLLHSGRHDLFRRQANALVDHFEASITCGNGHLLGAVGVAIEPGLAHEHAKPVTEFVRGRRHTRAHLIKSGPRGRTHRARDTGRGAELAEHLTQRTRPFAGGDASTRTCKRGLHEVGTAAGIADESSQRLVDRCLIARSPPLLQCRDGLGLHRRIDLDDRLLDGERTDLGLRVIVDAHDHVVTGFEPTTSLGKRRYEL